MGHLTSSYCTSQMRTMEFMHGPQASMPPHVNASGLPEARQLEIPRCVSRLSHEIEDLTQCLRIMETRLESAGILSSLSSASVADKFDDEKAAGTALGQALDSEACRVYSVAQAIRNLTMRLEA